MWNRAKSPGFIMRVHIIIYRECGGYQGGAIQPARTTVQTSRICAVRQCGEKIKDISIKRRQGYIIFNKKNSNLAFVNELIGK